MKMFKSKFTFKIFIYIFLIMFLSSIILAFSYITIMTKIAINNKEEEIIEQAYQVKELVENTHKHSGKNNLQENSGFVQYANTFTDTSIYIFDSDLDVKNSSHHMGSKHTIDGIAKRVYNQNEMVVVKSRKGLFDYQITVGLPIDNGDGVVVVSSPIGGIKENVYSAITVLLVSLSLSFLIAIILTILLSNKIARPIRVMNQNTIELIGENYLVRNDFNSNDEIGELAQNLNTLSMRLDKIKQERLELDIHRKEFNANISHEIKTPITVIKSYIEALSEDAIESEEKKKQYYYTINNEIMLLDNLVDDMLELSKLQDPNFNITKEDVNVVDILNDVLKSVKFLSKNKNIDLNFECEHSNYMMFGNYSKLRQMFSIALNNAIKFSSESGTVEIIFFENVVKVIDHGIGISPDEIDKIFTRFYYSRDESNKSGSGLGLSIAQEIANLHNIKIEIDSVPNKKTIVKFIL